MSKIFPVLIFVFALFAVPSFAQNVSAGNMSLYNFDDIELHAYSTGDNMNDCCYILESPEGLVMFESTVYSVRNLTNSFLVSDGEKVAADLPETSGKILEIAKSSRNSTEFTSKVKEAFPNYNGQIYLSTHLFRRNNKF